MIHPRDVGIDKDDVLALQTFVENPDIRTISWIWYSWLMSHEYHSLHLHAFLNMSDRCQKYYFISPFVKYFEGCMQIKDLCKTHKKIKILFLIPWYPPESIKLIFCRVLRLTNRIRKVEGLKHQINFMKPILKTSMMHQKIILLSISGKKELSVPGQGWKSSCQKKMTFWSNNILKHLKL